MHPIASFHALVLAFENHCHPLQNQVNQAVDQVEDQVEDHDEEPSKVHLV